MSIDLLKLDPHALGKEAEKTATAYLKRKGWRILTTNYHTKQGEIDIIGSEGNCLVFIEVKSSSKSSDWDPIERIDFHKQRHIQLAASNFISTHEIPIGGIRFDAILMTATERGEWKIKHLTDAFRVDDPYLE